MPMVTPMVPLCQGKGCSRVVTSDVLNNVDCDDSSAFLNHCRQMVMVYQPVPVIAMIPMPILIKKTMTVMGTRPVMAIATMPVPLSLLRVLMIVQTV